MFEPITTDLDAIVNFFNSTKFSWNVVTNILEDAVRYVLFTKVPQEVDYMISNYRNNRCSVLVLQVRVTDLSIGYVITPEYLGDLEISTEGLDSSVDYYLSTRSYSQYLEEYSYLRNLLNEILSNT